MSTPVEPDNIESLLPFYLNGTLSNEERREVEKALEHSAVLREELVFLEQIKHDVKAYQPAMASPGEVGWQRLQQQINETSVIEPKHRKWRVTAMISSTLLIAQSLWIGIMAPTAFYAPAGGEQSPTQQAAKTVSFQVAFNPNATEAAIRAALLMVDAQIISGPSALGLYVVSTPRLSNDLLSQFQSMSVVESANQLQ
jgi:hypothetical protein